MNRPRLTACCKTCPHRCDQTVPDMPGRRDKPVNDGLWHGVVVQKIPAINEVLNILWVTFLLFDLLLDGINDVVGIDIQSKFLAIPIFDNDMHTFHVQGRAMFHILSLQCRLIVKFLPFE